MKVAVIGATGRTGQLVVDELVKRSNEVRVLVRDSTKLGNRRTELGIVTGDSRNPADLATLVTGVDAVISALGPSDKETTLHRDTARALVVAINAAGVRRFVGVSGAGIDVPGDQKSGRDKLISKLINTIGGAVVKDKPAEYEVYAASGLDWTLVRPPRLADGPATGKVEHDAHKSMKSTKITRADLAGFLVDVAQDGLYIGEAPFVANA